MWNQFDRVKAFKYVCEKRKFHQNLCPPFLRIIFLFGRIHFVNTITVNGAVAS